MSQKLIGFYGSRQTAEQVEDGLINAGFDRDEVSVFSGTKDAGLWQEIKQFFGFADESDRQIYAEAARRGQAAVVVTLNDADATSESRALEIMQRYNPIDLNTEAQQWRAQGWTGRETAGQAATTQPASGKQSVPVVEERLQVGKRRVLTGGVRVHSYVIEKPVQADVQLREERVTVERRPVDRSVSATDEPFQERQIEVTETAEQPVVTKEARVVEEVVIGKTAQQRTQTVRDTVKRQDVQVEKVAPEQTQVADKFVTEITADDQYRGKDWSSSEPEIRRSFEQRYPGSKWDQLKDKIQRGFERARQKV